MNRQATPTRAKAQASASTPAIGIRSTRQRAAIALAIQDIDDFRSAQEIYEALKRRGDTVGLTTVYRSLQAMAANDDIDVLITADGESRYRRCGQRSGHHHHLVCRVCGFTVEVEGPAVEEWTQAVAREQGFTEVTHTLDVFGTCAACAKSARGAAVTG